MDADHVWAVLEEQGRMVKWLARVTDIPAQRLYDIRHRRNWWRDAEAEAISRALGVPRERLFGPRVCAAAGAPTAVAALHGLPHSGVAAVAVSEDA